jgi:hypothetical protein
LMAVTIASVPAVPGGALVEHQAFEMNVTLVTLSVGGADSVTWCWCRQSARTWPRTSASTGGYRCGQTRAISTSLGRRCRRAQQQLRWSVQLASGLSVARNAQRRARSSRWSRTPSLKELRRPRHGRRSPLASDPAQCRMGSSLAWSSAQHDIGGSLAAGNGPGPGLGPERGPELGLRPGPPPVPSRRRNARHLRLSH